jgi:hypothetical protein
VHALSLANMDGEYCSVLLTSAIVTAMA